MNLATHRTRPLWPALALAVWLAAPLAQAQQECPAGITPNTPDSDFAGAGAGMVLHKPTGLVWKRCAEGQSWDGSTCTGTAAGYTWQQAFERVDAVNAAAAGTQNLGATDWRLPNVNELKSIAELACRNPAINLTQFPAVSAWVFWSGSPVARDPDRAWAVNFYYGGDDGWGNRSLALAVRLVRGGQSMLSFDAAAVAPRLSGTAPGGTVGQVYAGFAPTLGPAGVTQPVTYALSSGNLPPGLALDPDTGAITGTPTTAGSYPFSLTATNSAGTSAPLALTIVVAAAGGGSGGTVAAVPTLGEWGLVLLGLLAAGMGARRLRRG